MGEILGQDTQQQPLDLRSLSLLPLVPWKTSLTDGVNRVFQGRPYTVSQLADLSAKLGQADSAIASSARVSAKSPATSLVPPPTSGTAPTGAVQLREEEESGPLGKVVKDGSVLT